MKKECAFKFRLRDKFCATIKNVAMEKCTDKTAVTNSGLGNDVCMLPRLQPGIKVFWS